MKDYMDVELKKLPATPEFSNSAGRLLSLLNLLNSGKNQNHFDVIASLYGRTKAENDFKAQAYVHFMSMVSQTFSDFIGDIRTSEKIPDASRQVILDGIGRVMTLAHPINPTSAPQALQGAEVALLRMAGSMLDAEPELEQDDVDAIRKSIDELWADVEGSDISKSAKTAMLELCKLSRSSIDYYRIQGARGFKKAFKGMLAELMAVYLDEGTDVQKTAWWKKAVGHAKLFDTVAAKLSKYKPLLESASTLFLGGS